MLFHVKILRKLGFLTQLTRNDSEHVFVWPRSLLSSSDRNPLRQLNDNISRNELFNFNRRQQVKTVLVRVREVRFNLARPFSLPQF